MHQIKSSCYVIYQLFITNLSKRNRAIFEQFKDKHCHHWKQVRPNEVHFSNDEFRIALYRRFLMRVHTDSAPCLGCKTNINVDPFGDHAIICGFKNFRQQRHNILTSTLFRMGARAGYTMDKEVNCVLNSSKVPADLFFHNWTQGQHLAVDVSVAACTNQSVINQTFEKKAFAAATRLKAKFNKYKNEQFYQNTIFTPVIFEEFGLWHPTTKEILHTICRRIAHRSHQSIDQIIKVLL